MSFAQTKDKVYQYLITHYDEAPSVREMCAALGIGSTSTVFRALHTLQEEGKVKLKEGARRNAFLATDSYAIQVPVLGTVAAGVPILAQESIETFVTYNSSKPDHGELFALHVKGESMIGAGILDGDIIIARKAETADEGEIVVALIGEEATVKRLYREEGKIVLKAENPDFQPIVTDEVLILGKVVANFRYYE
ncbi:MAG: repressor LexA [Oscillospiraceae bacterium]|nr:repressor LexA [Oscillospiraceae bacterium]